jgi:hypothetical protein
MFVRIQTVVVCFVALVSFAPTALAQPATGVIDKLLEFARDKKKAEPKAGDDDLRKLLIQRYNVALDELTQQCEDFKKSLTAQPAVFEAARHLVQADLEMQTEAKDRAKVIENALEIVKWYEGKLEAGLKSNIGSRAEFLRIQYTRLTFEIELAKIRREMKGDK